MFWDQKETSPSCKKITVKSNDLGGWFLDITDTKLVKYSVYDESVKEHDSWELNDHMLMIMSNVNWSAATLMLRETLWWRHKTHSCGSQMLYTVYVNIIIYGQYGVLQDFKATHYILSIFKLQGLKTVQIQSRP